MKPQNRVGHNIQSAAKASRKGSLYKSAHRSIISNTQFRDARIFSGFTREDAARFLNVSVRTIGHWETGRARPSYAAFKLLRVYRHGSLIHPEWSRCFINHRGALVTAEGREIRATDLDWLSLLFRRAECMGPLMRERDALRDQLAAIQARSGEAGARLGLVHYKTSDTRPSETQLYQGFRVAYPYACHGAIMGPKWPHDRRHSQDQFEAPDARSGGSQGAGCAVGGVPQRLHPVRCLGTGEADPEGTFRPCDTAQAQAAPSIGGGFRMGRSFRHSGEASSGQGWAERGLPMWQWSQGQALPSGVDLNCDASRNAGGVL